MLLLTVADEVYVGQEFDIQVQVNDVENLEGVDFAPSFDPQLLEVQDADQGTEGTQITVGTFLQGVVAKNEADNPNGIVRLATAVGDPGVTGSGDYDSDFNGDLKVDLLDLVLLAKNYDKTGDACEQQ